MNYILAVFTGIMVAVGTGFILCDLFQIPSLAVSGTLNGIKLRTNTQAWGKRTSTVEVWLSDFSAFLSKFIRMNEYAKAQLASDIGTAGMSITPEQHIANCICKALIMLPAIPIVYFISPILVPIVITLAVVIYLKEYKKVTEAVKEKRAKIEYELPRLVAFIDKSLRHNRDVLHILDSYRSGAGEVLKRELNITVADMRTSNYEAALTKLETRVGSTMLSDVTRGLIGVLRGDVNEIYWMSLSIKFSDYQCQLLKQEANKIPRKVKKLSMALMCCFMLIYAVVFVVEIISSLGVMFGGV